MNVEANVEEMREESLSKELAVVGMSDELKIRRWRTPAGGRGLFTALRDGITK
jgi:hypothetical protein